MPEVTIQQTDIYTIKDAPKLDTIQVVFIDHGPGSGEVLITCYGEYWGKYWGCYSVKAYDSVMDVFLKGDPDYLADKFTTRKKDEAYVTRIITAIQSALKGGKPGDIVTHVHK